MLDPEAVIVTATVTKVALDLQIETRNTHFRARVIAEQNQDSGTKKACSREATVAVRNGREVAGLHKEDIGTRHCGETLKQTEFLCDGCAMIRGLIW